MVPTQVLQLLYWFVEFSQRPSSSSPTKSFLFIVFNVSLLCQRVLVLQFYHLPYYVFILFFNQAGSLLLLAGFIWLRCVGSSLQQILSLWSEGSLVVVPRGLKYSDSGKHLPASLPYDDSAHPARNFIRKSWSPYFMVLWILQVHTVFAQN